jgi:hypothetical protein
LDGDDVTGVKEILVRKKIKGIEYYISKNAIDGDGTKNIYSETMTDHVGTFKMVGNRRIIRWHRKNELKI